MSNNKDFTTTITVNQSPEEVFAAINNVSGWWQGEIKGDAEKINNVFTYQMLPFHTSTQKVVELITNEKVVWLVTDSNLTFVNKKDEWTDTTIEFTIQPEGNQTKLTFTHYGLTPSIECYGGCSSGWAKLIEQSLFSFITTGKGVDVF